MPADPQCRMAVGCALAAEVVCRFGEVRLKVTGASMLPSIWPGDIVQVERREICELQPGQVVLCRREGKLTAHRIKSVAGDQLITQGDALPRCDLPIGDFQVLGQVVSILHNGRYVSVQQSLWQRAISSVLVRSDFCMRMTLRIGRRWQRLRSLELLWAG
ncbi:MAG: S24/S26 family peptidase [Candidatus Korobacteraceae bacterium]